MPLDWHSAAETHRSHLSAFCCTLPDHGYFDEDAGFVCHDYPWELEVQEYIRGLRAPAHLPELLLVGYDDVGLAAVIAMRTASLDRYCFIQAVAVAQRVSGHGLAGEAIALAPYVMSKLGFPSDFVVQARIDPSNLAAKSAFTRSEFEQVGTAFGYESWARQF